MIFGYINELKKAQLAINNISKTTVIWNGNTGLLAPNTLNSLTTAVSGLSKEQALLVLSTRNLSEAQKEQVLSAVGLSNAEKQLTAAQMSEKLATTMGSKADAEALLINSGLVTQKELEENATIQVTAAKLEEAVANGVLSASDAQVIAGALGISGVNFTTAASFDLLTASIWANIKAFATWLVTSPVGHAILAAAAIFALVKACDALTVSYDEAQENARESADAFSEAKSEVESLKSEIESLNSSLDEMAGTYDIEFNTDASVTDKISELMEQESLTLEDEATLEQLQAENAELERQLALKEAIANSKQQAAMSDARVALNATSASKSDNPAGINGAAKQVTDAEAIQDDVKAIQDYQSKIEELENANIAIGDVNDREYKNNQKKIEEYTSKVEELTDDLTERTENASENLSQLVDEYGNVINSDDVELVEEYNAALEAAADMNLTPTERELKKIDSYFSKSGKNHLKNRILDAVKSGKSAEEAFAEMGLSLEDAGFDAETLNRYFNEMAESAEKAADAVNSFEPPSVEDVEAAFESANKGADFDSIVEKWQTAKEMVKKGLFGTDDVQTMTQWILPYDIDDESFGSKAYIDAWEEAYKKVNKWFNEDNPMKGMWSFLDDLNASDTFDFFSQYDKTSGLVEFSGQFENSAQAAEELGVSLDVVDTMLHKLEDYGFTFDDNFQFSGEMLSEYKSALSGIQEIFEKTEDEDLKDRLGGIIDQSELDDFANNLDELTQDQIIEIQFQYDLAQLDYEIEQLKANAAAQGYGNTESNADIIAANTARQKLWEEHSGVNLSETEGAIAELQSSMVGASEERRSELQREILAVQELERAFADSFDSGEVTNWEDFLGSDSMQDVLDDIEDRLEVTKEELEDALSFEAPKQSSKSESKEEGTVTTTINVDTLTATEKLQAIGVMFEELPGECVTDLVANDKASDTTIATLANYFNIPLEVLTEINAEDGSSEVIAYIASEVLGLPEETVMELLAEDNASYIIAEAAGNAEEYADVYTALLNAKDNATSIIDGVIKKIKDIKTNVTVSISGKVSDAFNSAVESAKQKLRELAGGGNQYQGTVHASGAAHAQGTARTRGSIPIDAFTNPRYRTKEGEVALTGEEDQELVVHGDKWWTIGDRGAEFNYIPSNSIVFNAKQTKELLTKGFTNSRGKAHLQGTAFASGGYLTTGSSGSSSSSSSSKKSSSGSNSSSDDAESNEEIKDWIEVLISRIERLIENLNKTVEAAYKSWTKRNTALTEEIKKVNEEILYQQQGYNRYIQEANSVGLSEDWAKKVRDGKIDIETITDEDLQEKVSQYQEWYEKALACSDAIQDLNDTLAELARTKFDNVIQEYDDALSTLEHRAEMLEGSIDKVETEGYLVSTKFYDELIKNEQQKINMLSNEYGTLVNTLNEAMSIGNIEKYSEEWYSMQQEIYEVEEALLDANTAVSEYKNNIRELEWEVFDKLQEMISEIQNESDFLIGLMSDDRMFNDEAGITDQGQATLGLHTVNYNAYMAQADEYAKQLLEINKELAEDPYNTTLRERRQELLDTQREMIESADDEKQAIKDLYSEGYDALLDYMDKLIDKRKEMLNATKDLYDYEKNVTEQTKEISNLEKQLMAYQGNDSEEAQSTIQQIKVSLEEAKQNLEETEYDKYISDQEQMLDALRDETEQWISERLDNINLLLQNAIDKTNENANSIKETLQAESDAVGYDLSEAMNGIWSPTGTFGSVVTGYCDNFGSQLTTTNSILDSIKIYIAKMVGESDKKAETAKAEINNNSSNVSAPTTGTQTSSQQTNTNTNSNNSATSVATAKAITIGGKINAGSAKIYDYAGDTSGERQYFRNDPIYTVLSEKNGYLMVRHHKLSSGVTGWFKKSDVKAYKTGGLVDYTGLAQLDGTKSKPELVLNAQDTANFIELKDALRNISSADLQKFTSMMNPFIDSLKNIQNLQSSTLGHNGVNDVNVYFNNDITMNGVDDINGFITELRNSTRFEKVITEITWGAASGHGTHGKYIY